MHFVSEVFIHEYWPHLEKLDLASVTHALDKSRLAYCNTFYVGLLLIMVQKFELVQNAVGSLLMGLRC